MIKKITAKMSSKFTAYFIAKCEIIHIVPWTAKGSNQSFLKEISPEYSLEGLMYFGHLMRRPNSLEKTLMLGKTEGRRRRGRQRMRWLDGITDSMDRGLKIGRAHV